MNFFAFAAAFIIDRLSKRWAKISLSEGETKAAVHGRLYFRRARNYGFAGSVMSERPKLVRSVSAITLGASTLFALCSLRNASKAAKAGFSLMLGGGLSNLIDRYADGYVTDFICFKKEKATIYNCADFFIFAGATLCTVFSIFVKE